MNKTTCTGGATTITNSRGLLKKRQTTPITNGVATATSSGSLYVTNVNLYLHPNVDTTQGAIQGATQGEMQGEMPKVKTKCYNSDCFYYDCDVSSDSYYCCNPSCYCFKPDWYYYL
jgi:hypothetical protein